MGAGKIFFQGVANSGFSGGGPQLFLQAGPEVAKLHFHHSKVRKQFFSKNLMGKCHISKSDTHAPKIYFDKKAAEDNKNIFTNEHIMIF